MLRNGHEQAGRGAAAVAQAVMPREVARLEWAAAVFTEHEDLVAMDEFLNRFYEAW